MLGPMIAACGGFVPMISGRGLGHTGGTLDKFDSIPGYSTVPDQRQVPQGGARKSAWPSSARPPSWRRPTSASTAIRDVTATVESVAMITGSILSKKLAAGLDALVMDVKVGSGAFMPTYEKSVELAESHRQGRQWRRHADLGPADRHERIAVAMRPATRWKCAARSTT